MQQAADLGMAAGQAVQIGLPDFEAADRQLVILGKKGLSNPQISTNDPVWH
jgi:hypothetical protein